MFYAQSSDSPCSNLVYFRHQCNFNVHNAMYAMLQSQSGVRYHMSKGML